MNSRVLLCVAALTVATPLPAQRDSSFTRPRFLESVRGVPGTLGSAAHDVAHTSNIPKVLGVLALSALLFEEDDRVYRGTQRVGRSLGLPPEHPEWALRISGKKVFYLPTTFSSGLYYLGDGWTTMLVAGTFFTTGMVRHDNRALRTASEITQSMFALGLVTQFLKHATGRQTPSAATESRGEWHPFVGWKEYSANTPHFDAFPSGHLATAMATVTVIAQNYPDNHWVKPIGYTLMTGLSFAMVNNGVHWASDYPLALAIGGTIGKAAARRGHAAGRVSPLVTGSALGASVSW